MFQASKKFLVSVPGEGRMTTVRLRRIQGGRCACVNKIWLLFIPGDDKAAGGRPRRGDGCCLCQAMTRLSVCVYKEEMADV